MFTKISKICITLIIVFFSWSHPAFASFEITEIMYDLEGTDTNREWVEVKNTGSAPLDLSGWFFFSDNTKHALVPQGASSVPAGGYAIIAQNATNFMADWPSFGGLLFDSSWTGFNNEQGEEISLKDPDLNLVSPVTFTSSQGGVGDGDSLQNINGSWTSGTPTPGAVNQGGSGGDEEEEEGGGGTSSSEEDVVVKKKVEAPKMKTKIIVKNTVVAGVPLKIDSITEGYEKETLKVGKFSWNFGDGMSKEESEAKQFEYTYTYPGEYVLTLV
ncbi:MAG: lamin tail domain-containing protein, partial [Patescibacteria group bacterium]